MNKKIFVTKPYLPPLQEFLPYLQDIWSSGIITNSGPYHEKLEHELTEYLGVKYISLFNNGTIALLTAIKALDLKGEVITTPFTFAATSHCLLWNHIKPIFVDIDPLTLNLNPDNIARAITENTSAILPVHCYGTPCDVDKIDHIAKSFNLKVIYDAAHSFGVNCHCGSILNHGDLSVLSFHATKVFNTFEGGAIISHDISMKQKIDQLKNFGFTDEISINVSGLNGKMSEFNAALGLLQLKYVDEAILARKFIDERYRSKLFTIKGIKLISKDKTLNSNFSYFPIIVDDDYSLSRDELHSKLQLNGINARRYFYPLLTDLNIYKSLYKKNEINFPIAKDISSKILCLPIYPDLRISDVDEIINLISYS